MNAFAKTILATALLVSAPAFAEEAHHAPSTAADTAMQPGATGTMPGGSAMGMMNPDMMKQMMGMHTEMMRGMMSPGRMGMGTDEAVSMRQMMSPERIEGRIAFMRTELKVTDAQQPLWNAVADVLRETTKASKSMMPSMQNGAMQAGATGTALPQMLGEIERTLSSRLDGLRRLRAAIEPFYASLDQNQKKTADALLMPVSMM